MTVIKPRLRRSSVMRRLRNNGNRSPVLAKHLLDTCRSEPELSKRIRQIEEVKTRMRSEGVLNKNLDAYALLFQDKNEASESRRRMVDGLESAGLGKRQSSVIADAITANASELNQKAFIDVIFVMAKEAISANVPPFIVKDIIKENASNGIPLLFSRLCIKHSGSKGMEPNICEKKLLEKIEKAISIM